jgi:kynureninase
VHPELVERLVPQYPGWLGDARPLEFSPDFVPARGARRYQMGTPAIEPIYTARAGIRFVLDQGVAKLRERNTLLLDCLAARARALGLEIGSPSDSMLRAGMLAVRADNAKERVARLKTHAIDVDSRTERYVRMGPHWCVSSEECERAVTLLADLAAL